MIHQIIKGLKKIHREYQNLSHILISITGKTKFPSDKEDWKKFEQNNKEIALNVLFVPHDKKEIELAYTSKYNYKHKKQVILLMITDDDNRWHYLAVKRHHVEEQHQITMEIFIV